jgi:hypothetical protein
LVFAFTTESLKDATIFYFTCQGTMKNASSWDTKSIHQERTIQVTSMRKKKHHFYRNSHEMLSSLSLLLCKFSRYHDYFFRQIWGKIVWVKLEIMKLLGRYSQQQGKVLFEAMGRRIRARNNEFVNIISSCFIYCDRLIVRS